MRRSQLRGAAATLRKGPSTAALIKSTAAEAHAVPPENRRPRSKKVEAGMPTTEQQKKFAIEYLKDYDIMAAAKRAGYGGAESQVMKVFRAIGPFIREAQIAKAQEIGRRGFTSQERVLAELSAEAHMNRFDFLVIEQDEKNPSGPPVVRQKRLDELPAELHMLVEDVRFNDAGVAIGYSLPSRTKARELIARHLGMLNDKQLERRLYEQQKLLELGDLSNMPADELRDIERRLLKYMGPTAKRSIGEFYGEDEDDYDAAAGRIN